MNETLNNLLATVKKAYAGLTPNQKLVFGLVGIALAFSAVVGVIVMKHDPYRVLFSDLQSEDSRAIAKKLGEANIPYNLSDDGRVISVPESTVPSARMQLAKEGLPGQSVVGFEKFDGSTLGMSSYVQRIQYIRAVQGELTRSIERLASVKAARVHISVPPKKTFMEEQEPPKASVVLQLKPGQEPSKAEVRGIAHLVASAVEGLKVNQVTIVDSSGNFLHRPEDENEAAGLSDTFLEMQRSIETEYERRVVDILTPVVGFGKVKAKVTVEVDASRKNTTEETYDPDKAVAKTIVKDSEQSQGSRPNPIGIPGSRSNLPGAEVSNPQVPVATTSTEKTNENKTFAIPRKVEIIDKPSGNIKRLTVAVLVDGTYKDATDGTKTKVFTPRSDDELKRLQDLVSNSVGFDSERRDSITVMSMPFSASDLAPEPETAPSAGAWYSLQEMQKNPIRTGLVGLAALAALFFAFRLLFRSKAKEKEPKTEITEFPKTVAEIEASAKPETPVLAISKGDTVFEEVEPLEKKQEAELKKRIMERLSQAPKKGLRIVLDWIEEETAVSESAVPIPQEG